MEIFIKCALCAGAMQKSLHELPHLIIIALLWASMVVCNLEIRILMSVSSAEGDREVVNGTGFESQYTELQNPVSCSR